MDKLIITDLQFHGHCGISQEEREAGQRLSVDLDLYCDIQKAVASGDPGKVADYSGVAQTVIEIGHKERFSLIEDLAEQIAREIIKQFPVEEVVVRVKKIQPPVEAIQGYFGVEIRRRSGQV